MAERPGSSRSSASSFSYAWGGTNGIPAGFALNDGVYQLSVTGSITPVGGTAQTIDNSAYFERLYGDVTGDGKLNTVTNGKFKTAFANTTVVNEEFDYNGDGKLNTVDNGRFKTEFSGQVLDRLPERNS